MKKNPTISQFLRSIYDDSDIDISELQQEMISDGIDVEVFIREIKEQIADTEKALKQRWLVDAKDRQAVFEEQCRNAASAIRAKYHDIRALAKKIRDGSMGVEAQNMASAFFRNKDPDQISENDLISFIEDCELLKIIEDDEDQN